MKTTLIVLASVLAAVSAVPLVQRADADIDTTVLNFALTLEHLENAFYTQALANFTEKDFTDAGLPSWARGRFAQIAQHEAAHVAFLSEALGANATQPCNYTFPYTDPVSFAALSQALEGVGVSAYVGAAQLITNKAYLTAAAAVLSTEARHASWVAAAVNHGPGWSGAFDVPLGLSQVYSLAASFITSCPPSNPAFPITPFPALTTTTTSYAPGSKITLAFTPTSSSSSNSSSNEKKNTPLYVAFYSGFSTTYVPLHHNVVTIPEGLRGQVYAAVTTSNSTIEDGNTVAGLLILELPFDSGYVEKAGM